MLKAKLDDMSKKFEIFEQRNSGFELVCVPEQVKVLEEKCEDSAAKLDNIAKKLDDIDKKFEIFEQCKPDSGLVRAPGQIRVLEEKCEDLMAKFVQLRVLFDSVDKKYNELADEFKVEQFRVNEQLEYKQNVAVVVELTADQDEQ